MQYTIFTVAALAAAAVAAPTEAVKRQDGAGLNPNIVFTNATCQLPRTIIGYPPLGGLFPTATQLGTIVGPILDQAIGKTALNDIDIVAEDICISAQQDKKDGPGICNNIFQLVLDLALHTDKPAADRYRCLLNAICVAQESPNNIGTCQDLLAGVDCIANRIIGEKGNPAECNGKFGPY